LRQQVSADKGHDSDAAQHDDQTDGCKIKKGIGEVSITFNGGEILVDWKIIKNMARRISQKYPDMKINYEINTNLTLLNEEMAKFFNRCHFKVNVSIDGYKEAHDKTRKYFNNRGRDRKSVRRIVYFSRVLILHDVNHGRHKLEGR
jgi:sulfatase maturation enzyme AslB (radical SAM superfamily)